MARKLHVVVSQGQSAHPAKRKLEEDLVAALLGEPGIEVTVVPHLYDLTADGTGMLCLQSISGDMVVLSWLYPRAAHWILDRNQVRGKVGRSLLEPGEEEDEQQDGEQDPAQDDHAAPPPRRVADARPLPPRTIWCLDLRARETAADFLAEIRRIQRECSVATVELTLAPPPQAASASNGRLPAGTGNGTIALPVIFGTPTGNGERAAPFQPAAGEPTNASKDRIEPPPGPPSAEAAPPRTEVVEPAAAGAEIDPMLCVRRERQELQRVGNMPGPQLRQSRRRHEVRGGLPLQERCDEAVELQLRDGPMVIGHVGDLPVACRQAL